MEGRKFSPRLENHQLQLAVLASASMVGWTVLIVLGLGVIR
jgi:hypothetical protein